MMSNPNCNEVILTRIMLKADLHFKKKKIRMIRNWFLCVCVRDASSACFHVEQAMKCARVRLPGVRAMRFLAYFYF